MSVTKYEVVVLGAGSGGLTSAVALAKLGKKVLLVEKTHLGGECTNSGCIPSKALLHHAKAYALAISIAGKTEASETYRRDAWNYTRAKIAEILIDETPEHFTSLGIDVVLGEGIFTDRQTISVNDIHYRFKQAIIATGSNPRTLPIPGLDQQYLLTNQNIFTLSETPAETLIIGGGPIGMEMGQALAMLGSKVTIIENGSRFAKLEDEAIGPIITKAFTDLGITILTNASVKQVSDNVAQVEIKNEAGEVINTKQVPFTKVLVAIGRVPNLPNGLTEARILSTEFGITVNSNWQTSNKNIYALGDVAAKLKFTHVADDTARQVVMRIVSYGLLRPKIKSVPKVTYTSPEIGQVGLSWTEAKQEFGEENIMRVEVPFSANDRARTDDETSGLLVIVAKRLSGTILGAHIIGPRAGELIGTITLAIENNISLYRLRSTIFAYPTYSLILKRAGDYFLAQQFSSLKSDLFREIKSIAPKIIVACLWLWGLFALYAYQKTFGLTPSELSLKIFMAITSTPYAPILYILAYAIRPVTFFPGTALTILSGIFFGLWGILYTIVGAALSSAVAYFVGHFFSQGAAGAKKLISGSTSYLNNHPFMAILTMRLTFFPFDLVAYGAGLLKIPFTPFMLATILGTLLGITTFAAIGASISVEEFAKNGVTVDAINLNYIFISLAIFIVSYVVAEVVRRKKKITS